MRSVHRGLVALTLVLSVCLAQASEEGLESACKAQIATKFRQWVVASVTADVARSAESRHVNPTLVHSDFDGDGQLDVALLVQDRPKPVLASHVAICLSRPPAVVLHVIDEPYCSDFIERVAQGQPYYDFETGKTGTFPSDGVRTHCFEQASATYVYDGTKFRRIVDGD
jgi:hypothetical protein